MRLALFIVPLTLTSVAATKIPDDSPPADFCADFFIDGCSTGLHKLLGPGGTTNGNEAHSDCQVCWYPYCHTGCQPEDEPENVQAAYQLAVRAAARGDAGAVLAIAASVRDYVRFNAERESVQVFSCNRQAVIANLKLTPREVATAEELLPN